MVVRSIFLFSLVSLSVSAEVISLSPQKVVDLALGKSDQAELIELSAKINTIEESRVLKRYDFGFQFKTDYSMTKAESVDGFANEKDKRVSYGLSVSKFNKTGTNIKLMYEALGVNTEFSTYNLSRNLPATQYKDVLGLEIEQSLLNNSFGKIDRFQIDIAKQDQEAYRLQNKEDLEALVLSSMDLYWRAYVAKESLQESFSSRDRYQELLNTVNKKKRLGYSAPGEWARTQSELEIQVQKVKRASLAYLLAVDNLKRSLKLDKNLEIEFESAENLPEVPSISKKSIEELRLIKAQNILLENSEKKLRVAESAALPELNLVAKIQSTGLDTKSDEAISELAAFTKPSYYVGLNFRFLLGDNARGAEVRHANYNYQWNQVKKRKITEEIEDNLSHQERIVNAAFLIASSAKELLKHRKEAAKEIKAAFTQGRIDIQELINAYNTLSIAETEKILATGEYHMSLNRLSALRDELVKQ